MTKQFQRTELLIGKEGQKILHKSRVAVIGLGAVGSYAVEGLARAGVGHMCLIDCDVVEESNINRQLYALHSTIGCPKAELAKERVLDIYPGCHVEAARMFVHSYSIGQVLAFRPDVIVDAVDSLNAKVQMLIELHKRGVPVISSMGAALRTDPSRVRFGDISETHGCPLARLVRQRLKRAGIRRGINCVYSTEDVPRDMKAAEAEDDSGDVAFLQGRARRPLGSLPTLTGIFGLTIAHHTIQRLLARAHQ